jgi:hypothetical protein
MYKEQYEALRKTVKERTQQLEEAKAETALVKIDL